MSGPASLQRICQIAVAHSNYWRVQKRHIEALDEGDAAAIVEIMACNGTLPPTDLWAFRACLTRLSVQRSHLKNAGKWIACAPLLPNLRTLSVASLNEYSDRVTAQQLWALPSLASTLQTLHFENIRLPGMLSDVLMHLTSLTQLSIISAKKNPPRDALLLSLENLLPLTSLKELHLDNVHFGKETKRNSTMAPISQLTSLTALSLALPGSFANEVVDYSPGVMHVGLLPHLQNFKCEGCSCPPVCSSLTSLHWKISGVDSKWPCETARQVWIEWQSTLPRLKEFVFECDDGIQGAAGDDFILPVLSQIISGAASTLTSLDFKASYLHHATPVGFLECIQGARALQRLAVSIDCAMHMPEDFGDILTSQLSSLDHLQEIEVRHLYTTPVGQTQHLRRRCPDDEDEHSCWERSWTPTIGDAALPIQQPLVPIHEPEFLEALSPEVLHYDERFTYDREEMLGMGMATVSVKEEGQREFLEELRRLIPSDLLAT